MAEASKKLEQYCKAMSLHYQLLGAPGEDNALFVKVDGGQAQSRILFDCGENTVSQLPFSEVYALESVCFSHLHMDHIAGFDGLFRQLYPRLERPNLIYGPPQTRAILQRRLQGFLWNLSGEDPQAAWTVVDVTETHAHSSQFWLREAFALEHSMAERALENAVLLEHPLYTLEVRTLDHLTPSLAYLLRETERVNVNMQALSELNLKPGAWLAALKAGTLQANMLEGQRITHEVEDLERLLLKRTPGESIAYLTDFLLDEKALSRLVPWLSGVTTLVCECQYLAVDCELATRNYHMFTLQVAELAARAKVSDLILMHVSSRYSALEREELLAEVRSIFPHARFPESW